MGVVSGGGGAGTPFNGGTITADLVVDSGLGDGTVTLDAFGDVVATGVVLAAGVSASAEQVGRVPLVASPFSTGQTADLIEANTYLGPGAQDNLATTFRVLPSGAFATRAHAAPSDGAVATGECVLWFDQTNGASKLMVKAKTANGTVATAAIALS